MEDFGKLPFEELQRKIEEIKAEAKKADEESDLDCLNRLRDEVSRLAGENRGCGLEDLARYIDGMIFERTSVQFSELDPKIK